MQEDLRAWLTKMNSIKEIRELTNVDWNLEIGCAAALAWKNRSSPALLFDEIPGYQSGYRVLTGSIRTNNRIATVLDFPLGYSDSELLEKLQATIPIWQSNLNKFPPQVVDSGPILQHVHSGDDIDLLEFPVPKWHELDGGRYIGTGHAVITKDPDTGAVNLGAYRIMVHDRATTGLWANPGRHGRMHYETFHSRGESCPVLVSVGHHPIFFGLACLPVAEGTEYNYIGAIRNEPVRVIREEITGLPMPADSEIVIAGFCPPGVSRSEGPFGEWHGYYATKTHPAPIIEVKRIYHRDNPIIHACPPGRSPADSAYWLAFVNSALLYNELVRAGVPDVRRVWVNLLGAQLMISVSIKQRYAGHAKQAALLASQLWIGSYMNRYTVVVDEDIDVTDTHQVLWAMCTRSDPTTDIDICRRTRSSAADPTIRVKPAPAYFNSRAIIDACKPYEWIEDFPKVIEFNSEVVERVTQKLGGGV